MNKILSKIIIFILCFSIIGCKKKDKDLSIYKNFYEQDVSTFNYLITNTHSDYIHIANFVDGLVENDKYGNIVESIAKSWKSEIINNKQTWTFYLKDNVYWSDYKGNIYGTVTANDFVTSLKYILNYNVMSNNYSLPTATIENAINYYNATLIKNFNLSEVEEKIHSLSVNDPNFELSTYMRIKDAFDFCSTVICNDNFDSVGIKAINDFELQFTLTKPIPHFLHLLTYCSFLPANEKFIKEVGINNFGTNKKNLLYNGAYILNDYFHSSKIEYIKNDNYWDKANVFIDKIIFNKMFDNGTSTYTRLAYETGNIDEFYVNEYDTVGWNKYVVGEKGTGTLTLPVADNTYYINEPSDFTVYYFVLNQDRINTKYTSLSKDEIYTSNIALKNTNFRKALLYGINKNSYVNSIFSSITSSAIPELFAQHNNKDYHQYYIEEYASKNNISYAESKQIIDNNLITNLNKSQYYLNRALEELSAQGIKSPIKLEFSYFYSEDYYQYDLLRVKEWNNMLNGCSKDASTCSYDKIHIVLNESLKNYDDFSLALKKGEYSFSILGFHPNYPDPITYLESFDNNGELFPFLNHSNQEMINQYLKLIEYYYNETQIDQRFKLCAELEYKIIHDFALIIPIAKNDTTNKVVVSNLVPYQKMKASYGLSPYKFKYRKKRNKNYTQEDIKQMKMEYEAGRNIK